jgi:hypothetical protein
MSSLDISIGNSTEKRTFPLKEIGYENADSTKYYGLNVGKVATLMEPAS